MPRFFFDIFDGARLWTDDEGSEHDTLDDARREAVDTLTQMARDSFPRDAARSVSVEIRPDTDPAVERIVVALSFEKL